MKWRNDDRADPSEDAHEAIPSEEEVRRRAAAIRRGWSSKTRKRRRIQPEPGPFQVPIIRLSEVPFPNENN
ncbi:MAG: hypothetical protein NXI32_12720 [bacterium]|nr:hypothetical protein [bacterium]